jgi:putative SOS response-associated peptidase YedK
MTCRSPFAGLWERWGPDTFLTCSILTTGATDGIKGLHTRTPVILPKNGFEPWLSGSDPAVDPEIDAAVQITAGVTKDKQTFL